MAPVPVLRVDEHDEVGFDPGPYAGAHGGVDRDDRCPFFYLGKMGEHPVKAWARGDDERRYAFECAREAADPGPVAHLRRVRADVSQPQSAESFKGIRVDLPLLPVSLSDGVELVEPGPVGRGERRVFVNGNFLESHRIEEGRGLARRYSRHDHQVRVGEQRFERPACEHQVKDVDIGFDDDDRGFRVTRGVQLAGVSKPNAREHAAFRLECRRVPKSALGVAYRIVARMEVASPHG